MNEKTILVSACLLGISCRYDGESKACQSALEAVAKGYRLIPICPEQLGGLPTPRVPCEIVGGDGQDVWQGNARVVSKTGVDCTKEFMRGAEETLKLIQLFSASEAWLTAKSPSCGMGEIYDGSFKQTLKNGDGVCVALLKNNGIVVNNFTNTHCLG